MNLVIRVSRTRNGKTKWSITARDWRMVGEPFNQHKDALRAAQRMKGRLEKAGYRVRIEDVDQKAK